ncbi:Pycsar system effector family protein [Spirochaeta lutea]|uniref:Pycsar effector protein domain-containing protein n=1 Tax=Spirochaeta lutea TaxID=1480694 RepID=A0A098QZZ4_9SPIO|nr:Pycsar system effector family protein [Spirochaeta lutea]KGE73450.1 hypothetical protein DC28_03440 [Spirochaeta lutea]
MKTIREKLDVLLRILDTEQQILQRNDSKATALLSTLGVFMVFFIVHFDKILYNPASVILVFLYFGAALISILCLLMVIRPKIVNQSLELHTLEEEAPGPRHPKGPNPTFFGGITQFSTAQEYAGYLLEVTADDNGTYLLFAQQVTAIARINKRKNKWLTRGLLAFVVAISFELTSIFAVYLEHVL